MKCFQFLTLVLVLKLFQRGHGHFFQPKDGEHEEMASYVKALINDYDKKDSSTKDVVILGASKNKGSKQKVTDMTKEIYAAIPDTVAVYSPPLEKVEFRQLRSSSFVIIVSDFSDMKTLKKLLSNITKSEYYDNTAKFIFVAIDMKESDVSNIFSFFHVRKIANAIVIGRIMAKNGIKLSWRIAYDPFLFKFILLDNNSTNIDVVFPDKLIDLKRYPYKVIMFKSSNRLTINRKQILGPDSLFLQTVASKQNASIEVAVLKDYTRTQDISDGLMNGTVDICLNTGVFITNFKNTRVKSVVNTFDTDGFCAMIPYPEFTSSFDFILKPFDSTMWFWILASMICSAIAWRLLNRMSKANANSSTYFLFGFFSSFLGQLIPFREHRPMQKLILQLTIFVTFLLGNIYQGLIVSSITGSHYRTVLTTIDEMIKNDYSYIVDRLFTYNLNGSEYYQRMSPKIKQVDLMPANFKDSSAEKIVVITRCSVIDWHMEASLQADTPFEGKAFEFYYKLNEKFNSFYLEFPVGTTTFFGKRLNELSLRVFESGVKQAKTSVNPFGSGSYRKPEAHDNSVDFVDLLDIAPAFYLIAFGLTLASIVFVGEIFYHDFLSNLNVLEKIKRFKEKVCKVGKPKKHRIIQVRPINEEDIQA